MKVSVEFELEEDGRWITDGPELPGVMAYGKSRDEAMAAVKVLALRAFADRLEDSEASVFEYEAFWENHHDDHSPAL